MSFSAKLAGAVRENDSLLCIGLDPDPERIPPSKLASYLCDIIDATRDVVCAYKPNLAFYEQLGEAGYAALRAVLAHIPRTIPTIADAKRGDVSHTATAYARAIFDQLGFDAATVSPYLGADSVEPFIARADRGVLILCRTSNPGAVDFQDLTVEDSSGSRPLYEVIARRAHTWNTRGNVGLVTGATYPREIAKLRALCPEMPFLLPGIGAQAGDLESAVEAGLDASGAGIIVNASRAVIYASEGRDFAQAARVQALALRDAINTVRRIRAAIPATSDA